ncbi:phosphoadenosine phosphosulfate reductase family protein [Reyranella sp.]|uniref:phosphoadenosine phosphosulfate reductase domain-containing protein n=1 Tax=Reyranella sp. TaxID=1929291 RepID=UPI0011F5DB97|nr:phosphoadenosine phosphosulfate reductase family protein [Reyranella sp.]TAJ89712.1 MAG: phosphoadenosine phosphosulfate reductase [Reyranella sp.]
MSMERASPRDDRAVTPVHVIFASYGNDSLALIRWAYERKLRDVTVLYNETGWGAACWAIRVAQCEAWVEGLGFKAARTQSIGMEALVKKERGWPRNGMQFCTEKLKIRPSLAWLAQNDPEREAICLVGVRREESVARRSFPEWTEDSAAHGHRSLWAPLVNTQVVERDALLSRAGFAPLPHRSRECEPCINSNKGDIRALGDPDIAKVERIEGELGFTGAGKPRVMFRPAQHMGAIGIREIYRWAHSGRGQYEPPVRGCDSGMCGG